MEIPLYQPLTFILWKWNDPAYSVQYTAEHVNIMASMIARNTTAPHRIICITDDPEGVLCETFPLWEDLSTLKNRSWEKRAMGSSEKDRVFPSCYRRLKIFSSNVTRALGITDGTKVVSMDLDMVITDTLDPLFAVDTDFMGWHAGYDHDHKHAQYTAGYNGSIFMFKAGTCDFLWDEFDPVVSPQRALEAGYYGSDQGWLSYRMYEHNARWTHRDGIRHYYPELCSSLGLKEKTRIAVFYGRRWKPWQNTTTAISPWIKEYYV